MNYNENELVKMSERRMIELIFNDIQVAVIDGDEKLIDEFISRIAVDVKSLIALTNQDRVEYSVLRFINRFVAVNSKVRVNVCEKMDDALKSGIEGAKFERQSLLELKRYLKDVKKMKDYSNLALSFNILIAIFLIQNDRKDKLCMDANVWRLGINGIGYMPVVTKEISLCEQRLPIKEGISRLRK